MCVASSDLRQGAFTHSVGQTSEDILTRIVGTSQENGYIGVLTVLDEGQLREKGVSYYVFSTAPSTTEERERQRKKESSQSSDGKGRDPRAGTRQITQSVSRVSWAPYRSGVGYVDRSPYS